MDVFKSASFVFFIVCCAGVAFVNAGFEDATTMHDCIETLKDDTIHGGKPCSLMPEYMRCAIRTTGLMKSLTTRKAIQEAQDGMETGLHANGLYCSIDLFQIVNDLRAEGYTGESTRDPNKKLTYENAKTGEECVEVVGQTVVPCSQISDFLKCSVRTESILDFLDTRKAVQMYEEKMTEILRHMGVRCNFDMHKIIQELKAETKTGVHNIKTMSGDASPISGSQQHRGPTYKVHPSYYQRNAGMSTSMKGFEDATTMHDCIETLKDDTIHGGKPCSLMPEYMRCAIRTTGLMKSLTTRAAIQEAQDGMETGLHSYGLYCSIDLFQIVNDLRAEGYTGESTRDPNKKLTYENAKTAEECVEAVGQTVVPCSQISGFLKCNVRTDGILDFLDTREAVRMYEEKMTETLRHMGVHCDFDMHKIIQELKAETKTGVHNIKTMSGDASPISGSQQYRVPTYKVHHSYYYQRNAGVSTTMKGLNLGYMAIITVLSIVIAYIR